MGIMEYKTKKGRRWRAQVYRDGARVAGKAGFTTKKEALTWLVQAEREPLSQVTGTDFLTLATAYLEDMESRRQPITFQYKRTLLKRFIVYMKGNFPIEDLTQAQVDSFLRHEQNIRGEKTANRALVELKTLFNWACKKHMCDNNPFRALERFPEISFIRRVPTLSEIEAVKNLATRDQLDFIEVLLHTGARLSEVCALTWDDINFQNSTITLWTRKRKGGNLEPGVLPMSRLLSAVLLARMQRRETTTTSVFSGRSGRQFTRNSVRRLIPDLCKAAQVSPPFTAHSLRHWFATMLKDSGRANPFQIQHALRHKNLTTTEKYLHELSIDRSVADILDGKADE